MSRREITINSSDLEIGGLIYSKPVNYSNRLRSKNCYAISTGDYIKITTQNTNVFIMLLDSINGTSYIKTLGWILPNTTTDYTFENDGYLNILIKQRDDSDITLEDYDAIITIKSSLVSRVEQLELRPTPEDTIKWKIGGYLAFDINPNKIERAYYPL